MATTGIKLVVIGDGAVGKTCLLISYANNRFPEDYIPTVFDNYVVNLTAGEQTIELGLWDTAGQEEYSALRDQYMKTGEGFVLVYSITTRSSFEQTQKLRTHILRIKNDAADFPIILVGNKKDLENERVVKEEEGRTMAEKWGCLFIETSAKTNTNVNETFINLVKAINKWREAHPETGKTSKRSGKTKCNIL
eukprot:TRINITY_DN64_c0_g4_i1.p1 TRINITY_DN64_c0_g4~~TRINITY_DN64_c0_g4_i1.p1  ORF type:complete len:193 (-),score=69.19 TRINITY_DN64_c0_g4_i1:70-648(-)